MRVLLTAVRKAGSESVLAQSLASAAARYMERIRQYEQADSVDYVSEESLLAAIGKLRARSAPIVVLLDGRGKKFSSEELAAWIARQRDSGAQNMVFAVGPADGWSDAARGGAGLLLSLGPMTLPHELARVVLAEQVYRALTILAGHPYHRE